MASAMRRHFSRVGRYALLILSSGLFLRRMAEIHAMRRCASWSSSVLSSVPPSGNHPRGDHFICIVPMYREQEIAVDTVKYWDSLLREAEVDEVLFVTTAKEDGEGEQSTHSLLKSALAQDAPSAPQLRLLHCTIIDRFRAAQLNLAVHRVREHYCSDGTGASRIWIGVYNADSRPQGSTFGEVRQRAQAEKDTRLYQQLVDYAVPRRPGVSWVATGNAVLQTWWTHGHYWARNSRGSSCLRWWSATSPFSTFGHGEFIRLDLLDEINGFPNFAYADGLLLGWICRLMGERIGLLASRDRAEVPRTVRDLLIQQHAWLQGLLNFNITERWARANGRLRLAEPQLTLLRYEHLAIPVAWGLSTPVVVAGMAVVIRRFRRSEATMADFVCLLGLASYPVIPALASTPGYDDKTSWCVRSIATAASWVVEGLAFWPAVVSHVRKSQAAPTKTPR